MLRSDWAVLDALLGAFANSKLPKRRCVIHTRAGWSVPNRWLKFLSSGAALIPHGELESAAKPVVNRIADIFKQCTNGLGGDTDAIARDGTAPAFTGLGVRIEGAGLQADAT